MSSSADEDSELAYGRASLESGTLQGTARGALATELAAPLENLSAAASELLRLNSELDFPSLFASLGSRGRTDTFQELTLISPERVYLVQRDRTQPELALVAVSPRSRKLGLLLSAIRACLSRQGHEP